MKIEICKDREILPRKDRGVDWGAERTVLCRRGEKVVAWVKAHAAWQDRLTGYASEPAQLVLIDTSKAYEATTLHRGGRCSKKLLAEYAMEINDFIGCDVTLHPRYTVHVTETDPIEELRKLVEKWGGTLEKVSRDEIYAIEEQAGFAAAPFTGGLGVFWKDKRILFTEQTHWSAIIHEMGHVFVGKCEPENEPNEFDFFGWEYLIAKRFDIEAWRKENADYVVTEDGKSLGDLTNEFNERVMHGMNLDEKEFQALITERLQRAEELGMIQNGEPVTLR